MNNIIDIFKVGVYKTNIIDKNIEKYLYGVLKDTSSFVLKSNKGGLQTKPILDINEEINKKLFITPAINFCKQMGLSKNIKIQTDTKILEYLIEHEQILFINLDTPKIDIIINDTTLNINDLTSYPVKEIKINDNNKWTYLKQYGISKL